MELWVYLPPGSGVWVANGVAEADLPPQKSWNSWALTGGRWLWWQIWSYGFICHPEVGFGWQMEWQRQICHQNKVGRASCYFVAVDCGGKFGTTSLVATRKWDSGGKRSGSGRFATKAELKKTGSDWWLLIVVVK